MSRRFSFVQFEFPWVLGPPDGRLVLRAAAGTEPEYIVVLGTLGATERRSLLKRRGRSGPRPAPPGPPEPTPVTTTRATVIEVAVPESGGGGTDPYEQAVEGLQVLNRVVHAFRIATADPYVSPLKLADAIAVRAGWGAGEQVAEGRWSEAVEMPREAIERRVRRRSSALRPQERLAALLSARDEALDCEELALRARLDLDQGRIGAAALGVRLAIDSALVELPQRTDLVDRVSELRGLRTATDEPDVRHAVERLEAALRARTAHGLLE